MRNNDRAAFHKLYGLKRPKVTYYARDAVDYALMIVLCAVAVGVTFGVGHVLFKVALALFAFMLVAFVLRHGVEWRVPLILRRPQDVLYAFTYKALNLRLAYVIALGLLLLEQVVIAATPNLPHYVGMMGTVALALFYLHLVSLTIYRTVILASHLAKKELVREVLMQTPWRRVINEKTNITLEIVHAYCTGLLANLLLVAPWYLVITHASFSVLLLPLVVAINVLVHLRWMNAYSAWFYRDHWLGHNSELEFIYLHGAHHDAIPSALIASADSGFLEGFFRFAISSPVALYNPVLAALIYTYDVKSDVDMHQYIPGVYPRLSRKMLDVFQHSTHHYGRLEPYGLAFKLDQPGLSEAYKKQFARLPESMKNSFALEEELTGLEWNNPTHVRTLSLWDKYQKQQKRV
jgi:hypothetical protein